MQDFKKEAAKEALKLIQPGTTVGFGAGSTIRHLIDYIKEDIALSGSITTVTSSFSTRQWLQQQGLAVREIGWTARVDLYFDGCDQFDRRLNALKSGGGVHTTEKILAAMADTFILVGDAAKRVERLDSSYPLVVEVVPEALAYVTGRLQKIFRLVRCELRMSDKKDGAVITERGNFLIDSWFSVFPEPAVLNERLAGIPGILEHSLFYDMAQKAVIAGASGIEICSKP
jgi:ribose 5-phosphate isomerase A